jgi:hypothetical protein
MAEYDPEWIAIQVASIDPDAQVLKNLISEFLRIVHASEDQLRMGSSEFSFGWHFYQIGVASSIVRKLAQLPESGLSTIKGDSIEQKFANWLNHQTKNYDIDYKLHFTLISDLKSSRYGFF